MKKPVKKIMVTLLLFCSVTTYARTWPDIEKSGELRVGVAGDYAPLAFRDQQDQLAGYDIDMARSLASQLKLKVQFVSTTWPTLSADLAADKFDIAMGGVTETANRKAQFALSSHVLKNGKIALIHCDNITHAKNRNNKWNTLKAIDRPKVRVIVNPGGTNQAYVDEHIKQAHIIRAPDNVENLQWIREGKADVMFTDLIEGNYYQAKEPGVFCVATPHILPGTDSYKVYMMSKSNRALLKKVNRFLKGNTKKELALKWKISA